MKLSEAIFHGSLFGVNKNVKASLIVNYCLVSAANEYLGYIFLFLQLFKTRDHEILGGEYGTATKIIPLWRPVNIVQICWKAPRANSRILGY